MRHLNWPLLVAVIALVVVTGCGSHGAPADVASTPSSGLPAAAPANHANPFGLHAPSVLLGRHSSVVPALVLSHDGAETDPALSPRNAGVDQAAEQFNPDWEAGNTGTTGLAYALYRFNVAAYTGVPEVRLSWFATQTLDNCVLGLPDFTADRWRFLPCPADGVLELTPVQFAAATDTASGNLLVVPVFTGHAPWILSAIRIGAPLAIDSVTPTSARPGMMVKFSAQASGAQAVGWVWTFGGAAASGAATGQTVTVQLEHGGYFPASVTATDERGRQVRRDFMLTVEDLSSQSSPTIAAVSPTGGAEGQSITLSAQSQHIPSGTSWVWNFGGGATPNTIGGQTPQVLLGNAGQYAATVTANTGAASFVFHFMLNVNNVGAPLPPSLISVGGQANLDVTSTLTAQGSGLEGATLTWDLPATTGSQLSSGSAISFTPATSGAFVGSVTATNPSGSSSIPFLYNVRELPAPMVTGVEGAQMTAGVQSSLMAYGVNLVTDDSYLWDFGGACTPSQSSNPMPIITPLAPGQYACSVTCSSPAGSSKLNFPLVVVPRTAPTLYEVTPSQALEGVPARFYVYSGGTGPFTMSWDFGGGCTPNASTDETPQVTPNAPGTYSGSVTVRNSEGSATLPFSLQVIARTKVDSIVFFPPQPAAQAEFTCYAVDAAGELVPGTFDFGSAASPFPPSDYFAGPAGSYQCTFTADAPYDPTPFPFTLTVVP